MMSSWAAARSILSATVAFVALSRRAEYAYGWLSASPQRLNSCAQIRRLRGWRGRSVIQARFWRGRRARQCVAGKGGKRDCLYSQDFLQLGELRSYWRRLGVVRTRACVLRRRGGMRRSGALTLGVVLTLGGVTGGRGQELSGSLAAASAPSSGGFVLPALPENWADLPFTLSASQTVSYNSNINALPLGSAVPGRARRFHVDDQRWFLNQSKRVQSTAVPRRDIRGDTLSSPDRL